MTERGPAIEALKETAIAIDAVATVQEKIRLVSRGYGYEIPTNANLYLARVSQWLHETMAMLESEIAA